MPYARIGDMQIEVVETSPGSGLYRLSVNPGSLTLSGADIEIGAVELKDGTTDARAPVDGTYGVAVDVKRSAAHALSAGEAHVGEVGAHTVTVRVEKTRPSDAAPYVANDIINESTSVGTPFTIPAARAGGPGSGVIIGLGLETDDVANLVAFEIDVYEAAPTTAINDNFEGTHLYVDSDKFLQSVLLPALVKKTANSTQAEAWTPCSVPFDCADNTNLYMRLRIVTGFTPGSGKKYKIVASIGQD